MTLWLVRHGPTHQTTLTGWRDVAADLSDTAALKRLEAALPRVRIIASDLTRARQTRDAVAMARPRLPDDASLREMDFGDWDGRPFAHIDPAESRAFWDSPGHTAPPGGESWNSFTARVQPRLAELADEPTIVICHMGVIMAALQMATQMPARASFRFEIAPLSLTVLRKFGEDWAIDCVNRQL